MKYDDAELVATKTTEIRPAPDLSFTIQPLPGEGIMAMINRLAVTLEKANNTIVNLMVFGSVSVCPAVEEAMQRVFGRIHWPITWVEGAAHGDQPVAGMQVFSFRADQVKPVMLGGQVVGSVFEDGSMRHCLLGGLVPSLPSAARPDQFRQTLDLLQTALKQAGFSLEDVIRTWFYLDELLSWYDGFNEARIQAFAGVKFRGGSSPASTGISGRNPVGTALVAGAWAVQPLHSGARVEEIQSPLQCPAADYGSLFSRAMEITSRHDRRLLISGTASIASEGQTLWPGNVRRQIDLTMQVVGSILTSRGFVFSDITRATAYFKNREEIPEFAAWCADQGLHSLPVISAQCGICRKDLLFELEADARRSAPGR